MPNFSKAPDEVQKLVQEISMELNLHVYAIDFEALYVEKQKEPVIVKKASQVTEYLSKRDDLVLIMLSEKLFESDVDPKTKYLWLRMGMDTISYDGEKDKIVIGCPMISVPVGFYEKFKGAAVDACLLAHYTMQQIEEKEKEEKERQKAEKKANRKKKF